MTKFSNKLLQELREDFKALIDKGCLVAEILIGGTWCCRYNILVDGDSFHYTEIFLASASLGMSKTPLRVCCLRGASFFADKNWQKCLKGSQDNASLPRGVYSSPKKEAMLGST